MSAAQQPTKKPAASQNKKPVVVVGDTGSLVVATVNGVKITRAELFDTMMANQAKQETATFAPIKNLNQKSPVAAAVGQVAYQSFLSSGQKSVMLTRKQLMDGMFKYKPQILAETLNEIIQPLVIIQAAKKEGISATDGEVGKAIAETVDTQFRKRFRMENQTDAQIIDALGLRKESMIRRLTAKVLLDKLSEKALVKELGHAPSNDDYREASHILVRVETVPGNEAETQKNFDQGLAKIRGFAEQIKSKEKKFEEIAANFSEDGSRARNGNLGVMMRGTTVPDFDKVMFMLEPGVVSEPVKTQFGWHLIRVNRLGKDTTGPERADALKARLAQVIPRVFQDIMSSSKIENSLPLAPQKGIPGQG